MHVWCNLVTEHVQQSQPDHAGHGGVYRAAQRGSCARPVGQPGSRAPVHDQRRRGTLQHPGSPRPAAQPDRAGGRPAPRIPHLLFQTNHCTSTLAVYLACIITLSWWKTFPVVPCASNVVQSASYWSLYDTLGSQSQIFYYLSTQQWLLYIFVRCMLVVHQLDVTYHLNRGYTWTASHVPRWKQPNNNQKIT